MVIEAPFALKPHSVLETHPPQKGHELHYVASGPDPRTGRVIMKTTEIALLESNGGTPLGTTTTQVTMGVPDQYAVFSMTYGVNDWAPVKPTVITVTAVDECGNLFEVTYDETNPHGRTDKPLPPGKENSMERVYYPFSSLPAQISWTSTQRAFEKQMESPDEIRFETPPLIPLFSSRPR